MTRCRCLASPAGCPAALQLFLDIDNRLGVLQLPPEPRILPLELRHLRRQRIARRRLRPSFDRRQAAERASGAQSAPIAQGRRIQAFPAQDGAGAARGCAVDLRQDTQLVLPSERPSARPVREFGSCRRWGCHGDRPPASHRVSPSGTIRLRVFVRHNHVISVLRPEAKLFGLRCLMIIGTEGLPGRRSSPPRWLSRQHRSWRRCSNCRRSDAGSGRAEGFQADCPARGKPGGSDATFTLQVYWG
jgi:hypothetical protein